MSSPVTDSPCRQVCVLDPVTELCIGCGRTSTEIAGWMATTAEERRAILAQLPERLARMTDRATRGGRTRERVRQRRQPDG
jgi:hypothetical protein